MRGVIAKRLRKKAYGTLAYPGVGPEAEARRTAYRQMKRHHTRHTHPEPR